MNIKRTKYLILVIQFLVIFSEVESQTLYIPNGSGGIGNSSVNGNIGIGIPNPETPLNILVGAGGINGKIGIRIGGVSNYSSLELGIDGDYDGLIRSFGNDIKYYAGHWKTIGNTATENHSHLWYTSKAGSSNWSSLKMTLNHDGNLGIGVNSPREKLDVEGKIRSSGLIYSTFDGYPQSYLRSWGLSGGGDIYIEPAGSHHLHLTDSWAKTGTFTVNFGKSVFESGNVLIGKTTQSNNEYKLDVAGKIRADEIIVNTTGADFVFGPAYKLLSLSELETFIKTYKHLPDIESAEEMQKKGIASGEMHTKLLQKIEELTLYVIDLKNECEKIQVENEKKVASQNQIISTQQLMLIEFKKEIDRLRDN